MEKINRNFQWSKKKKKKEKKTGQNTSCGSIIGTLQQFSWNYTMGFFLFRKLHTLLL